MKISALTGSILGGIQQGERRYRYYVSGDLHTQGRESAPEAVRVPAKELEDAVFHGLDSFLANEQRMMVLLGSCDVTDASKIEICLKQARAVGMELQEARTAHKIAILQRLVHRVQVQSERLQIEVRIDQLLNPGVPASDETNQAIETIEVPIELKRVGMAVRMIVHAPGKQGGRVDDRLLAMIAKAHDWFERLSSGLNCNVTEIATAEKVSNAYVIRVLHLAFLAPDIVQRFREGNYPITINCDRLTRLAPFPMDWGEQRTLLGMSG